MYGLFSFLFLRYFYILFPTPAENIIRYDIPTDIFAVYCKKTYNRGTNKGPPPIPTKLNRITILGQSN